MERDANSRPFQHQTGTATAPLVDALPLASINSVVIAGLAL
jgi:hypothetical protein